MNATEVAYVACLRAHQPIGCGTEHVDVRLANESIQVRCYRCDRAVQLFDGLAADRLHWAIDPDVHGEPVGEPSQMPSDVRGDIQRLLADALAADFRDSEHAVI